MTESGSKAELHLWIAVIALSILTGCGEDQTPCSVHADCSNSRESLEAGRCGPMVACVAGGCIAWCPDTCTDARAEVNPCSDPGHICALSIEQSIEQSIEGPPPTSRCSATEIQCSKRDDCPLYKPGADGEWACEDGICRFPGFHYVYENP